MSLRMLTAVWESSKHNGGRLLLMLAIADNANDLGYAWPGEATLARKTRLSKRQVHRLIHELAEEHDELAVAWGGTGARSTNRYYILVGKKEDEIQTILHHVSEWNDKRQTKTLPLPLEESRAGEDSAAQPKHPRDDQAGIGDILSPITKGDIPGALETSATPIGDICANKGDIAVSPEPINRINHQQQNRVVIARVTISLFPSPHLNRREVDGDGVFLVALLDDLDIHGKKRREIERLKPKPEFVLAYALYAASRSKAAGWVIVETLAQSAPPYDFITFARLSPAEWLALWRGSARGEWSTLQPALYQMRGAWMQSFEGVFKREPFTSPEAEAEQSPVQAKRTKADTPNDRPQTMVMPESPIRGRSVPSSEIVLTMEDGQVIQAGQVWQSALGELQLQLTGATYNTWLGRTQLISSSIENGAVHFVIGVHNGYAKDWLEHRLLSMIERTLAGIIHHPVEVSFVVWNKELEFVAGMAREERPA